MKMKETGCSETSVYKIQTPGNYQYEIAQNADLFLDRRFGGPEVFPWGKDGRCVRLTTYHHPVPFSRNLGTLTFWRRNYFFILAHPLHKM
jgi:hypothetical protein